MPKKNRYHAEFFETVQDIRHTYGEETARAIMNMITMRHGGSRIWIPDPHDIYREERDRQIRAKFTGFNHQEMAILFRLSISQVRRIVLEG